MYSGFHAEIVADLPHKARGRGTLITLSPRFMHQRRNLASIMVPLPNIANPPEDAGNSVARRAPRRNTQSRKQKNFLRSEICAPTQTTRFTSSNERMNEWRRMR